MSLEGKTRILQRLAFRAADQSGSDLIPSGLLKEQKSASQFVGFTVDGQEYAFRIEQIQEIVILDRVTQTPQVADYVEGFSNLRGAIIPIINLRKLFGLDPKPADSDTRTIVVNAGGRTMGCTVDLVSQVIRIPNDNIQPVPESITADGAHYISGFARLNDRLIVLLDIDELLSPEKLSRVRKLSDERPPAANRDE
jgi:purine-binding chemotaxis protein CheW